MESSCNAFPAPYGRACSACARAKCRCLFQAHQSVCERCHRLGRECQPGEVKRSRGKNRKVSRVEEAVGKAAELERKFDRLVAELKRGGNGSAQLEGFESISSGNSLLGSAAPEPASNASNLPPDSPGCHDYGENSVEQPSNANVPLSRQPEQIRTKANISAKEAESRFERFKNEYLRWAPFVYFPPGMTAAQLYDERPTFWLSIMLTCETSQTGIHYLDGLLRKFLAEEMVVRSTKSMDLLLALITSLSWYNHHCRFEDGTLRLSMTLMSHLATSLVFGLKGVHTSHPQNFLRAEICKSHSTAAPRVTTEESRAMLACYLITNSIHLVLHGSLPLHWASYLQECLRELQQNGEWEGDEILVQQVRIQKMIEKAIAFKEWEASSEASGSGHSPAMTFYVPSLRAELEGIKESIRGRKLLENEVLKFQVLHAELVVHEFGLSKSISNATPLNLQQLRLRSTCLNITKTWLTEFTSRPAFELNIQPLMLGMQLSTCLSVLFHLTTVAEPGWGREQIDDIDVLQLIDRLIEHMRRGAETLAPGDDDTVSTQHQLYRSMKTFWASRLIDTPQAMELDIDLAGEGDENFTGIDEEFFKGLLNSGFCDNQWLMGWPGMSSTGGEAV